ncbi:MAG: hypothetical protein HUU10_10230 [Bacteroidetes bacterium]|nr:hypothetical protein [Bacteroidota bacterium]
MGQFVVNKTKSKVETRNNTLHRRLTQQLMEKGVDRDLAIKHSSITISMAAESFDRHGKSVPQVVENTFKMFLEDLQDKKRGPYIDVYNRRHRWEPLPPGMMNRRKVIFG